jgi:hypothetical protein
MVAKYRDERRDNLIAELEKPTPHYASIFYKEHQDRNSAGLSRPGRGYPRHCQNRGKNRRCHSQGDSSHAGLAYSLINRFLNRQAEWRAGKYHTETSKKIRLSKGNRKQASLSYNA